MAPTHSRPQDQQASRRQINQQQQHLHHQRQHLLHHLQQQPSPQFHQQPPQHHPQLQQQQPPQRHPQLQQQQPPQRHPQLQQQQPPQRHQQLQQQQQTPQPYPQYHQLQPLQPIYQQSFFFRGPSYPPPPQLQNANAQMFYTQPLNFHQQQQRGQQGFFGLNDITNVPGYPFHVPPPPVPIYTVAAGAGGTAGYGNGGRYMPPPLLPGPPRDPRRGGRLHYVRPVPAPAPTWFLLKEWSWIGPENSVHEDDCCPVCAGSFCEGDLVVKTDACDHAEFFHKNCMVTWLRQPGMDRTCPLCRKPVPAGERPAPEGRSAAPPPQPQSVCMCMRCRRGRLRGIEEEGPGPSSSSA